MCVLIIRLGSTRLGVRECTPRKENISISCKNSDIAHTANKNEKRKVMEIYWKIQQNCAGIILHVDKELMRTLGYEGAKDYYCSKAAAETYAKRYANAVARCGMSTDNISVVAGTF